MVFISKNLFRKCRWCENEKKKNLTSGSNKGYYSTCGSSECLKKQYDDAYICAAKGRRTVPIDMNCVICHQDFKSEHTNHKRYCKQCVPDKSWRGRAQRYGIGKPQWDQLLKDQNGTCALCDRFPEVVDHCHSEGIVRGLLCNKCNTRINILDEPEFLKKALKYVGKYGSF